MLMDRRREMGCKDGLAGWDGDLSMVSPLGKKLSSRETANCYVIWKTGTYRFPLVYGCAIINDSVNSAAYTQVSGSYTAPFYNGLRSGITSPFIETDINKTIDAYPSAMTDSSNFTITNTHLINGTVAGQSCRFVEFTVTQIPPLGGNALIQVQYNGQTEWSWHIWAYPPGLSTFSHTNTNGYTYNFLNVNLGWVKSSASSKYGTCPFYQWGRKDPFLRSGATGTWRFYTASTATYVSYGINEPTTFYIGSSSYNYNWVKRTYFYNYWDASSTGTGATDKTVVKTVYDPSPVGFTVPCGNAFLGFSKDNGGTWDSGRTWDGNYFPAAGYRYSSSGGINYVGSRGYYWLASSYSQLGAYRLNFSSENVSPQYGNYRAYGFSVRPVARPQI